MELDTYCCLIFYGFTLIHLTGPLSQVVQIKCVMCNIYMNLFIYIYREREREREMCVHLESILFSSLWRALPANTHTLALWTEFWEAREELIDP